MCCRTSRDVEAESRYFSLAKRASKSIMELLLYHLLAHLFVNLSSDVTRERTFKQLHKVAAETIIFFRDN